MVRERTERGEPFPSTRWSRILGGDAAPGPDLEALALAYWRPIHGYVWAFVRGRGEREDPGDLTQTFFVWLIEGSLLERADPARGRFRGFLKRALRHFLIDEHRRQGAEKRGGTARIVALEDHRSPARSPEEELDELWRAEVLERAGRALELELKAEGKAVYHAVFRDYYLSEEELDYAAVAARHGITKVDVSNYLQQAKKRYRRALREAVAETVGGAAELEEELAWLLGEEEA